VPSSFFAIKPEDSMALLRKGASLKSRLSFILGGARSGKSRHSLSLLQSSLNRKIFFATCPRGLDSEMEDRILRHQEERSPDMELVESDGDLQRILDDISENGKTTVLMDCLTLWLFSHYPATWESLSTLIEKILLKADLIIVSNEIGLGLVPADRSDREFRDLLGHLHQRVATRADEVTLMVAGIPLKVK